MSFITYIYIFQVLGRKSMLSWLNINILLDLTQVLSSATN